MRVLVIPEWYPWEDGSYVGQFCREQVRAVAADHDIVVLSYRVTPELRTLIRVDESCHDGVRTFRLQFGHMRVPKLDGAAKLAGCLAILTKLRLSGWSPDLIHAHEYEAGRTALMLRPVLRVPVVVSEHYSGFALGTLSPTELRRARSVFARATIVSPVSNDLAERLKRLAPTGRFKTIPNTVDTSIFRPSSGTAVPRRRNRRLRLVTVGSLVEVKGHRYLLEAVSLLRRDLDVELDLIGEGPLRGELVAFARSLGMESAVRFLGRRTPQEIAAALRGADLFVLPSLWETFGCALVEALACGLPSVATRVGAVAELMDAETGVTVVPRSAEALADGIAVLSSRLDEYEPSKLAQRIEARYGFAAVARRWSDVYSAALTARP